MVAQWIRPWTLNCDVPGLNLIAAAVVPLGNALSLHYSVPRKGLKVNCSLFSYFNGTCFLSGQVK